MAGRIIKRGPKKDFVNDVVDSLIERLKEGTAPWQLPWNPDMSTGLPINATTGNRYKGINSIMLSCQGKQDPRWMTFVQAKGEGWNVKKGESGTQIQYWKTHEERVVRDEKGKPVLDDKGNKQKARYRLERPRVFYSYVFNAEQIDGIPAIEKKEITWDPIERAETILINSAATIENSNNDRAYYSPSQDIISLPKKEQFDNAGNYYSTALHELGHWTGHESRLDRNLRNPFGSQEYAKEELRAEIASMIMGQELHIGHNTDQNVAYVASWIKALEEDPLELFRAATDAEKICTLVSSYENEQVLENNLTTGDNVMENQAQDVTTNQDMENQEQSNKAHDEKIYLNVPYKEKNEAKTIGAKWDKAEKSWYFTDQTRAEEFKKWTQKEGVSPVKGPEKQKQSKPALTPEKEDQKRRYLSVPYGERLAAKNLGAKWDKAEKSWFVDQVVFDSASSNFSRWSNLENDVMPAMDPKEEFRQALVDMGCDPNSQGKDHPIMDGSKQRITVVDDKKGELSGFYIGHLDGHPAGYIKNHRSNSELKWKSKGYSLSEDEKAMLNAVAAEKKKERITKDLQDQEATAKRVAGQLKNLKQVEKPTPYMVAKGIAVHKGTFTDKENKTTYLPIVDVEGKQWSMAYIQEDGTKRYAKEGKKEGCFHAVGKGFHSLKDSPVLILSEGYSTAAAITQAVGFTTVAVFDSGNLPVVAKQLRDKNPDKLIIICGDDDLAVKEKFGVNPGRTKAETAAREVGGVAIFPIFAPGEQKNTDKEFTDFNDLAQKSLFGKDGVKFQVEAVVKHELEKQRQKRQEKQQVEKQVKKATMKM